MLMILILLILGGLRRRERSGAPWLHLIIRLLRILILLVILHGVRELILGWLFDEAHHVLLCIWRTSHSSITEGRLLLLAQDRLLFLFLRDKVMHCDDRLPRIWLSITRLGVLAFIIIVHWRGAWASEIIILALSAISIIILIIIGGTITDIGLDIVALLIANGAILSHKAIAIVIFNFLASTFTASVALFRFIIIPYNTWTLIFVCGGLFATKERRPFVEKIITGATFTFIWHRQARCLCVVHLAISAVLTVRMRFTNDSFGSILVFGLLELRVVDKCVSGDHTTSTVVASLLRSYTKIKAIS